VQMIANFMSQHFFKFIYNYYLILNFIMDVYFYAMTFRNILYNIIDDI